MAEPPLLELDGVRSGYGEAVVLDDVSLALPPGGSLAILGRNGVGKTTLLLTIMGFVPLARGRVRLGGRDISRLAPHLRARAGLGWVPQEREVFRSLTVEENLTALARPGRWDLAAIYRLFPRLQERRGNLGGQLSGGEQQMLAIARTLTTNPTILLLDEPLEGLAPIIAEEVGAAVRRMTEESGMALVLIEQHAAVALRLTHDAVIMQRGRIAHAAPSAALLAAPATLDRHLALGA